MLKLRYTLMRDQFQYVTVFGDPEGIRNLYWQLTHNYKGQDGQTVGSVSVYDTDGNNVTNKVMSQPYCYVAVTNLEEL